VADASSTAIAPASRAPRRPGPGRLLGRIGIPAWRLIVLVLFLVVWHLLSIPAGRLLLPSPLDVVPAFWELILNGRIFTALGSSLLVFGCGYALAICTAVPIGVLMGGIRPLGETLEVYISGLNSTPRVAFIPLLILWFGLGLQAKIIIVWLTAVFPIIINTYAGVLNADRDLIEAARSFGATRGQIFRRIMLPCALPYIIAGLRIGASLAIIGTVVAELYTALSGLGHLLAEYGNTFQTAKYFVPVIVLLGLGVLISQSLKAIEHRLGRWKTTSIEF
jgi:ABC-type nitrate/sulfonate/bicarbonate transport system permease component